ncbi:mechanosensitive ion channel family protein [Cyclobacterium jeungdonense]|uniref:Mechanosensitive ion channel n=1 Tax=Cyclobacterium jeungdonense TaxID=708087 RepID=A0ABT8C9P5_9BACT|nr:mechanosensitive ion channel domain-containing protein [Cyclobacterium jeungdonense]MDN3689216.1 mechanosensitive ion channel [Cyclobacterium jeungdonense]
MVELGKSKLEANERRKRIVFVVKILAYLIFTILRETLDWKEDPLLIRFSSMMDALVFLLAGNILISLGRLFLVRFYLRKTKSDSLHSNFVLGINHIANMLNVIFFLFAVMIFFQIKPIEFLGSIALVAAAIAILSKDYITNMFNGLIIMFSDQITLGDFIQVGENKGKIQDITLLNVVLMNDDGDLVLIPNSLLLSLQVVNHSRQSVRRLTFEFEISNRPGLNVDRTEEKLRHTLKPFHQEIKPNGLNLKALDISKDTVKLKLQIQLNTPSKLAEKKIRRLVNQTLIDLEHEAG